MKTSIQIMTIVLGSILSSCSIAKTTTETINTVKQKIESKNFNIKMDRAIPLRMRTINLTSSYTLKIVGDSAFAHLPYYGVAQSAPYGSSEGGIKFAEPMTDFNYSKNLKKQNHNITFKVKTGSSNYQVRLEIFENGSTTANISSYERDAITFYGDMDLDN